MILVPKYIGQPEDEPVYSETTETSTHKISDSSKGTLNEIFDLYMGSSTSSVDTDVRNRVDACHEKGVQQLLNRLNDFISEMKPKDADNQNTDMIEWQMDRITMVTSGEPKSYWEMKCLSQDIEEECGNTTEQRVLYLLKGYRIFLFYWAELELEVDPRLIDKIHEVKRIMTKYREKETDHVQEECVDPHTGEPRDTISESSDPSFIHDQRNGACSTTYVLVLPKPDTPVARVFGE